MKTILVIVLLSVIPPSGFQYQRGGLYWPFEEDGKSKILTLENVLKSEFKNLPALCEKTLREKYSHRLSSKIKINAFKITDLKQLRMTLKFDLLVSEQAVNCFEVDYSGIDSITAVRGLPYKKQELASCKTLERFVRSQRQFETFKVKYTSLEYNASNDEYCWHVQSAPDTIKRDYLRIEKFQIDAKAEKVLKHDTDTFPMIINVPLYYNID